VLLKAMVSLEIPDISDSPNQPTSYDFLKNCWKENCCDTLFSVYMVLYLEMVAL